MPATESHYSVKQAAEFWGLSEDAIRQIFRDVPGVIKLDRPATRTKRGYMSLRIPQSVLDGVHEQLSH
jgi:hypothetical protein